MNRHLLLTTSFLFAFTTFFLFLIPPAPAQIRPKGAEKLQTIFEDLLGMYEETATMNGAKLVREGAIMVETGDTYYAITLPHLSIEQKNGAHTEIGMIAINALPGDTDEQWKMTIALPTPIIHYDEHNNTVLTANIAQQSFAGIWQEKFKSFVKLNAEYKDINILMPAEKVRMLIPQIAITYDLQKNKDDRWSGPANFKISDLQLYSDDDNSKARIGEITVNSTIHDYSIDAALDYQEKISAINQSQKTGGTENNSLPHIMGLYNLITTFIGNAWDGFEVTISIKDLALNAQSTEKTKDKQLKMAHSAFGFKMGGFRSGAVSAGLKMSYDGFKVSPATYNTQATPDHMNFDLSLNNLPYKEVVKLGRNTIEGSIKSPATAKLMELQALMMLPQLLTQSETNIELKDSTIGNKTYNILTNGKLTANIKAIFGATGKSKTEIFGLNNLIDILNTTKASPDIDDAKRKSIKDALSIFAIIKMIGQIEKNAEGQEIRAYNFELNKKGEALLNGTDLKSLLQATKKVK